MNQYLYLYTSSPFLTSSYPSPTPSHLPLPLYSSAPIYHTIGVAHPSQLSMTYMKFSSALKVIAGSTLLKQLKDVKIEVGYFANIHMHLYCMFIHREKWRERGRERVDSVNISVCVYRSIYIHLYISII